MTKQIDITQQSRTQMLGSKVERKLKLYHRRWCFEDAGCLKTYLDHGPRKVTPPIIPYVPLTRARLYAGNRETGSYNHHAQLAKFKDRYYCSWSNGLADEEAPGQRILVSSSKDAANWTEAACVAGNRESNEAYHSDGLLATDNTLYLIASGCTSFVENKELGMRRIVPDTERNMVYASSDGTSWKEVFSLPDEIGRTLEAPRATVDGCLMCAAATATGGAAILRWPGPSILEAPEIIAVPEPHGARFPYAEASWYQTDDGVILVFWRDEGETCRLWVNTSVDGGKTFSSPVITDIPDAMSRVFAGRLCDGRHYVISNAFPTLLNRHHLTLLLSDDGYCFNKVYIVMDDPTSQRCIGLLKADGYQYPCCLAEEDRLLVAYSVNKEDMECAILDVAAI